MPYSKLSDLPPNVKKLNTRLQQIWMGAFNGAYKEYNGDEQKAFATAWAAVNKQRSESLSPKFQRIQGLFQKRFGVEEGLSKFELFLANNDLDPTKDYNVKSQYEAYEWIEPLIKFYRQDDEAKYYAVTALTCNVSMNNNDYSDWTKMQHAAETLSWRPINLNHDHSKWLSFPRTRVDFGKANDLCVEATIRVDNHDRDLQDKLDSGDIIHPSIEARGNLQGGYTFTGLALLEKGEKLPGDPLTEILPIFISEAIGSEICKITHDGTLDCGCIVKENMAVTQEADYVANPEYKAFMKTCMDSGKSIDECNVAFKDQVLAKPYAQSGQGEHPDKEVKKEMKKETIEKTEEKVEPQKPELPQTKTEATATYCTFCGTKLQEDSCPNKDCEAFNMKVKARMEATVNEATAIKDKEIAKLLECQHSIEQRMKELESRNAEDRIKLRESQGKLDEKNKAVDDRNKRIEALNNDLNSLREDVGKLSEAREQAISEKNEALSRAAKDSERANQEIGERAKIQRECADLREKYTTAIRTESETSQKLSNSSLKILDQEGELKTLREDLHKRDDKLKEMLTMKENLEIINKRQHKILKNNGIYEVDGSGNVIL